MKTTDYLMKRLLELKIEDIFGLPGDFNFKIVESIEKNDKLNWIGCINELNASYAADGYARIKGFGAVVTTFGVGELSAINGIAGSNAENVPVIQITGVPSTKHIENKTRLHHNLADVNYYAFKSAYEAVIEDCAFLNRENAKSEIDRLIDALITKKKPVYLAIPDDICDLEIEENYNSVNLKSDEKILDEAINQIISTIEKSNHPVLIADVLTKRFDAKDELNKFLSLTKIPSTCFIRGIGIINSDNKNFFGTYAGKNANKKCYDYVNSSDCVILTGGVISDLNTMNFDFKFDLNNIIEIQPNFVKIKEIKYKNILMNDVLKKLNEKIKYISKENIEFGYVDKKPTIEKEENLTCRYIYPRLKEFLKENDIFINEVGLVSFGVMPMKLPKNIEVLNQMMWGSIGWATPCALGCAMADKNKRTILVTGDGSHQLTSAEISTMMRHNLKPIIFIVNNAGYTIERLLCDDINYKYNDIAKWNYSKIPEIYDGKCFTKKIKTNKEFDEVLKEIENIDSMCLIELVTDYLDIPPLAISCAKHPEKFIS